MSLTDESYRRVLRGRIMACIEVNRRGKNCQFELRFGGAKTPRISLGWGNEMQLLEICLRAADRLDVEELRFLRDANKRARWKDRVWIS